MVTVRKLKLRKGSKAFTGIRSINGDHPFKEAVPGGYVEYEARLRRGGKVTWFNFRLAREMGLLPAGHGDELTPELAAAVLDTFSIIIINEYDITTNLDVDPKEKRGNGYMATRYLQLQHPDKRGKQSGDGRSIWNGFYKGKGGRVWDISSCGTGATCLSPAAVINNKFYKSGDRNISYGCGYSNLSEGLIDVLFSEIFERNSIQTERVLCVIEYPGSFCVTVRAGLNLIRPSHFFNHLRQQQPERLRGVADLFIEREIANKTWKPVPRGMNKYKYMLRQLTRTFALATARFESDYIFCWLDWDGDNVLADGGVIDFGSVRQFGLYHHEYKFDDDARWSTNIKQQKGKALHMLQSFAQVVDYLNTGRRRPRQHFSRSQEFRYFERVFREEKRRLLLIRMGFRPDTAAIMVKRNRRLLERFEGEFYRFERRATKKGPVRVPDGINRNVVYSMRDILRELPAHIRKTGRPMDPAEFLKVMLTRYADAPARKLNFYKKERIMRFQKYYRDLIGRAATIEKEPAEKVLATLTKRSAVINRYERITGDAMCIIGERLLRLRKELSPEDFHLIVEGFISAQVLDPDRRSRRAGPDAVPEHLQRRLANLLKVVEVCREGL